MFDYFGKKIIKPNSAINKTALEQEIVLLKNHIKRLESYKKAYELADAKIQMQEKEIHKLKHILKKAKNTIKFYYKKYGDPSTEITKEVTDYIDFLIKQEMENMKKDDKKD